MSALDMVSSRYGHPFAEDVYLTSRAELAALRATVTAQAAALEQAREMLVHLVRCGPQECDTRTEARDWLAAQPAPAPDEAQT